MSKIQDNICKLRDLFGDKKNYQKIYFAEGVMNAVFNEIHRQMKKKSKDYTYELDFTSQDLRELVKDIQGFLKSLETAMNPEKNIKKIWNDSGLEKGQKQINFDEFSNKVLPIMDFRREFISKIYALLNLLEYHSVYIYYLELAANDQFAIKYTERIIKNVNE